MRGTLLGLAASILLASPSLAASVACTPTGYVRWGEGLPVAIAVTGSDEEFGPIVFALDLETGDFVEHLIGGRAGISGGGEMTILAKGDTVGRVDFVVVENGRHSYLRIMLWRDNMPFVRIHQDGSVDAGTCVMASSHHDLPLP